MQIETVIMTTATRGTPHRDRIKGIVHVHEGPEGRSARTARNLWANCDRQIRDWWRSHRETVKADHVAFVEWDVVVNFDLAKCIVPGAGLVGRVVDTDTSRYWPWWPELGKLPTWIHYAATSLRPLAVVIASRDCLDAIADPEWDEIFKLDVFCELRLPTVAVACGCALVSCPKLCNVQHYAIDHPGDAPGVWHAVKS